MSGLASLPWSSMRHICGQRPVERTRGPESVHQESLRLPPWAVSTPPRSMLRRILRAIPPSDRAHRATKIRVAWAERRRTGSCLVRRPNRSTSCGTCRIAFLAPPGRIGLRPYELLRLLNGGQGPPDLGPGPADVYPGLSRRGAVLPSVSSGARTMWRMRTSARLTDCGPPATQRVT